MTQAAIEDLLRQKIGLDSLTVGSKTIARCVNRRMEECGLTNINTYLLKLQESPQELEELIETVVIPETWFFRDREPFVFLTNYAVSEWFPKYPNQTLRVLSLPCSTGEEPYSIAIALFEVGLSPTSFSIDAVDISKVALKKAISGLYGRNSFRDKNLDFRNRYFTNAGDYYQLNELVRSQVNFIQGNIFDPYFLIDKHPYDAIFCRNVLIYFDDAGREQTIQLLNKLLKKQGILFLGHSETGQKLPPQFISVRHPLAFAYRKTDSSLNSAAVPVKKDTAKTHSSAFVRSAKRTDTRENLPSYKSSNSYKKSFTVKERSTDSTGANPILPNRAAEVAVGNSKSGTGDLETAQHLADRGQLQEAAKLCETYLSQNRTNADAYVLLGQVYQAKGDRKQAEQCFQKATYLNPNHYEGLIHLALLKEERGDLAGANIIRQRIQRRER
ncbi:MAG: CheR family methyltransferase [Microcoleus sp.]